jgi:peptide/nickel transport system permease protein
MRYFLQKLSQLLIVVFAVTFTVSLALSAIPNAEERILAAKGSGAINDEEKNKLLDSLNLREPALVQYGYFVQDLVTLDWGTTFNGNQPISTSISDGLSISIRLMIYGQLIALLLAIPVALAAAYRSGGIFDRLSTTTSFAFISMPNYVLATVLGLLFTVRWQLFPAISEDIGFFASPWEHFKNFFLPTIVLAVPLAATYMRLLRADLINTLQSDFITTARAKGVSTPRILFGHALRPSLFSLVTAAAVNVGALVGGSVVVETAFNLNGLGRRTVLGIFASEFRLVQITVVVLALVYVLINFLVDILYGFLDPRVRAGRMG